MAPRRSAAAEVEEPEEETVSLQFDEPLTWRPGKPIPIDQLLKRLDRLSKELSELDQEVVDVKSLVKVSKDLAHHQLLTHKDKGVRAYTACCIVDILKLCAPNAPFTPSQLKDIFHLTITIILPALFDPSHPYNNQHKYVLRSLAEFKSIVLLLDVDGSDSLMVNLFTAIFDGVSGAKSASGEQVAKDVEFTMQELLGALIEESSSLPARVIDAILAQFLRAVAHGANKDRNDHAPIDDNQATLILKEEPEAYQMAKNLCNQYPEKMARFVSQYFSDVILEGTSFAGRPKDHEDSDDEDAPTGPSESDLRELKKSHRLIREIWKAAPQILQNVVPQVDAELSADNASLRQLATETLGDMISGIGAAGPPPRPVLDPAAYPPLKLEDEERFEESRGNILTTPLSSISFPQTHHATFHSFISRKNDKVAAIRATWTTAVGYILSTSAGGIGLSRDDEASLIQGLGEKLSDNDEKVRLAAVRAIELFKFKDVISKLAPGGGVDKEGSILSTLADRCRDRKPAVRVAAMSLLSKLWAVGTGELLAGHEGVTAALSGVPTRILNAFYANDLELNVLLDRVIYECLVPMTYPPIKKKKDASNGKESQSQSQASAPLDGDAIRAQRILLLVKSLDQGAKKAFFAMQARQPQFAQVVDTFLKHCDQYNGGVMDEGADKKTSNLNKSAQYMAQFLPDPVKAKADILKFAKMNDRRSYNLIRYVTGQQHDFKTVHNALKELIKRILAGKDPSVLDALLPLLYRSGCIMFNRSHLSTIMEYSKSDEDGMGAVAHEVLNEISQRNPDLFKAHIGQLCKDLVDQAPTATRENDPVVVETLKACSTYARKYPKDVPMDKEFSQTMINYALYGGPPRAAKYAVNTLLSKKDQKSMVSATDLLKRIMKDWTYGSPFFLNKLTAVCQLEYLAPKVTEDADEEILNMTVQQILLQVRTDELIKLTDWVEDNDLDEEIQAKCLALRILVNRLRSMEDVEEAKEKAKPVWKMLIKLIKEEGELSKGKATPKHHRSRLRLLAAKLMLKLCTQKHFDDLLSAENFNTVALIAQDSVQEVRHAFIRKVQKYLTEGKLRSRYYTIVFLLAFEPVTDFKNRVETWIRSRARHFQENKQPVLEAIMARLLSLLAHHPDYGSEIDELMENARYLMFYITSVGTESNLGLIYKYAERVKQTVDSLDPESGRHRVLSDLAQAAIRKWQEKKGWAFIAYPGKVGLPLGLYAALKSHTEAQEAAEKQYTPDGVDERLEELFRAMDRKKKRKSSDDRHDGQPQAKKAKLPSRPKEPKEPKPPKSASKKPSSTRSKKRPSSKPGKKARADGDDDGVADKDRRRSGRARGGTSYIERDSSEDDEEMLDGVAEWDYFSGSEKGSGDEEGEESEANSESEPEEPKAKKLAKKPAPAKADSGSELSDLESDKEAEAEPEPKKAAAPKKTAKTTAPDSGSELSDLDEAEGGDEKEEKDNDEEEDDDEQSPPPRGKAANGKGKAKAKPKAKAPPAKKAAPAKTRGTRASMRRKQAADDEMDEDED
ncbi:hypothetical protein OQA88_147 [Cercophora sp. LCS_1]